MINSAFVYQLSIPVRQQRQDTFAGQVPFDTSDATYKGQTEQVHVQDSQLHT